LVIFGVSHEPISAIAACLLAGASWTVVLTKLYVSAQVALPDWARGRGLAIFLTFIFGATTAGSAIWGKFTEIQGLQHAYFAAAAGLLICIPLSWRWKLQTGAALDLSPALHWRAPTPARRVENNQGPVLVVVEYRVEGENRGKFQAGLDELGQARKRDGAYAWGVYETIDEAAGRFVETFLMDSWLEVLHERERRTNADEAMLQGLKQLLVEAPRVTFSIASDRPHRHSQKGRRDNQGHIKG
jgi:Transmembrane secretion effector